MALREASTFRLDGGDSPENAESLEANLWLSFCSDRDPRVREQLIKYHADFARVMAGKFYSRRITDEVEFDEYLQIARLALIECVDRYDPEQGATFRTFAAHRISGAVLDGIEALSERSRQLALRRRTERDRLASLTERLPGDESQDPFERLASVAVGLAIGFMLDDTGLVQREDSTYTDNGYQKVYERQLRQKIVQRVSELGQQEAVVVRLHYLQSVPFDEIGRQMELSKGRISQIHRSALGKLRATLGGIDKVDVQF